MLLGQLKLLCAAVDGVKAANNQARKRAKIKKMKLMKLMKGGGSLCDSSAHCASLDMRRDKEIVVGSNTFIHMFFVRLRRKLLLSTFIESSLLTSTRILLRDLLLSTFTMENN